MYLSNRKKALDHLKNLVGYKTCHHIDSLDATKCADDCKRMEEEKFAKNCTDTGGLFKCCIRRDKMGCHECRFCCTLPMCTYDPGNSIDNTVFDMKHKIELGNQKNKMTANELFFSSEPSFSTDNYDCLKPDSHEDPKEWQTYEHEGFKQAFNDEMLKNTAAFPYDKYLYNFEDPKIFHAYTKNEKKAKKIWKNSYNWETVKWVPGIKSTSYVSANETWMNMTKCIKKCIKMKRSKFAKKCKKQKGYFKCCVSELTIHGVEENRNRLIREGFIKDEPTNICDHKSEKDPCAMCIANGVCTKQNPLNGKKSHFFYPKMKIKSKSR